jgi:cell division protein FtsQ
MAKKNDGLTPRQRQSRQLMEEKATRKKREALMQKCMLAGGGIACVALLAGGIWCWKTSALERTQTALANSAYALSAQAGFVVKGLYLEGRNRTSIEEIEKALDIKKGDPILRLSINEVRARLEKIESVKMAAIDRSLPGTLHVRIVEREPVAMWQHEGKMALVDDNGAVMTGLDMAQFQQLPLILGDDAPKHVSEVLAILASQPDLVKRFAAAIHVGERRWNIRLSAQAGENIEIKLPETDPAAAWKKLAELETKQKLLDRDIKVIDLRMPGRMFIKLVPENEPIKPAGSARDT